MRPARLSAIVAADRDGVIGADGRLPWTLATDLARFKRLTTGHAIVMGRKTFESIGRVLPGRRHVVLTRDRTWRCDGVEVVAGVDEALGAVAADPDPFVIGGGEIYREFWPFVTHLHLTRVLASVPGDVRLPVLGPEWRRVGEVESVPAGPRDAFATTYELLERA